MISITVLVSHMSMLHDRYRSLDLPLCHDLVANFNAAGPVVTIGTVDISGRSHQATVGQSLVLSCNTAVVQGTSLAQTPRPGCM